MSLNTRSVSAQNSPLSSRSNSGSGNGSESATTTPTRKAPHCRQCGQPMKGHLRAACRVRDEAEVDDPPTEALKSLNLKPSTRLHAPEDDRAFARKRRQSAQPLAPSNSISSLDADSSEIVTRLLESPNKNDASLHWQGTVPVSPKKPKTRTLMPCTLVPPSPTSSLRSLSKEESPEPSLHPTPSFEEAGSSTSSSTQRAKPLGRTLSEVERDDFLRGHTGQISAVLLMIPKAEVEGVAADAEGRGFHFHILTNQKTTDSEALLIVGRNERSIENARKTVENEDRRSLVQGGKPVSSGSNLKAAIGGAAAGALSTFVGLAFS